MICTFPQVLLTPNSEWGGEGSLGCGIGYGYLHRIPVGKKQQKPPDPELGGPERAQGVAPPLPAATTSGPSEGFADVSEPRTVFGKGSVLP